MNWLKNELDYYTNRWAYCFFDKTGKVVVEGEIEAEADNSWERSRILDKHPELGGSFPDAGYIRRIPKSLPRRLVIWLYKRVRAAIP